MIISAIFFYLFSAVTIGSGMMVIGSRNPVHSVLFLILAFVNSAGLFMLLGAEFLAMILVVVYVGAVAVLFLFVVMMPRAPVVPLAAASNTAALGNILYTRYVLFFQAAGFILLVAMIGAIVLTLRHKAGVKRQSIAVQVARPAIIDIRKVEPGKGLT